MYFRYLPSCIVPDSKLHIKYAGEFSCAVPRQLDPHRNLTLTIKGYDLLNRGEWCTTLTVKVIGNCSLIPHGFYTTTAPMSLTSWSFFMQPVSLVWLVVMTIVHAKKFKRNVFKLLLMKQYKTDLFLMQTVHLSESTCTIASSRSNVTEFNTSTKNSPAPSIYSTSSELLHVHQEVVVVVENDGSTYCDLQQTNAISNTAASDTVSAGTNNTTEANTDSDFSSRDSILTGSDPQQSTAIISNSIPFNTMQNNSSNSTTLNTNSDDHQEINPWLNGESVHCDLQQANSINNFAASDTVSAGTNTTEANIDSDFPVRDSILTGSDPQQPISNSIPFNTIYNNSSNSAALNTNSDDHQVAAIVCVEINPWLHGELAHCNLQQVYSINNMAASDTVSAGTNTTEANTDIDFSAPDSILTGSDPQQLSAGFRSYRQQVSISLSETISMDCEPQQANTLPNTSSLSSGYNH